MNKKKIVTRTNITKLARFLKESTEWLKSNDMGCCHFKLDGRLEVAIGWLNGYDMADDTIISSPNGRKAFGETIVGYAICAGVRLADAKETDFDYTCAPIASSGDCYDDSTSLRSNMSEKDYEDMAKYFLSDFVDMSNMFAKGQLVA